jgi:hypothetical protein
MTETHRHTDLSRSRGCIAPWLNGARRGIAMLLVLISLACSTVLAVAYLSSRENSPAIGGNIGDAAAARWAASSGLHLALAVLETRSDWRTQHDGGRMFHALPIYGGHVTVEIVDRITRQSPTSETRFVEIVATALVGGVEQQARAVAHVPLHNSVANVDLGDFAAFASDQIEVRDRALVARWPTAPESALRRRIAVGTRSTSVGAITIHGEAAMIDGTAFLPPGVSSLLLTLLDDLIGKVVVLDDPIPLPSSPPPPPNPPGPAPPLSVTGFQTVSTSQYRDRIEVRSDGVLTLAGNIVIATSNEFRVRGGGQVIVTGDVKLIVHGNFLLETDSAFEVAPGGRLTAYLGGTLDMTNAYLGDLRNETLRDNSGYAPWMDLQRIQIYSIVGAANNAWDLKSNSVLKGSIYAPQMLVRVRGESAVYGRIAARQVLLHDDAALFYDHALDRPSGYTRLDGPLYEADGRITAGVRTLSSVTTESMTTAASTSGLELLFGRWDYGVATPVPPDDVAPGEPTPRTVRVTRQMTGFGGEAAEWEDSLQMTAVPE